MERDEERERGGGRQVEGEEKGRERGISKYTIDVVSLCLCRLNMSQLDVVSTLTRPLDSTGRPWPTLTG